MYDNSELSKIQEDPLWWFLEFFLCIFPFFPIFCCTHSNRLSLSQLQSLSSQLRVITVLCCVPLPCTSLESASRVIIGITLCHFFLSGSWVLYYLLCKVWNNFYMFCLMFHCKRACPVPMNLSYSEAEGYKSFLYEINFINRNGSIQIFCLFLSQFWLWYLSKWHFYFWFFPNSVYPLCQF